MEEIRLAPGPRSDVEAPSALRVESRQDQAADVGYVYPGAQSQGWKAKFAADPERRLKLASLGSLCLAMVMAVLLAVAVVRGGGSSTAAAPAEVDVTFLAVGDWGRAGKLNQSEVADLMAAVATRVKPQFVISTGDNMYPSGLNSSDDPLFDANFKDVYTHSSLQLPWHAVMGNHDYGDGPANPPRYPMSQLSVQLVQRDWRWHLERSYSLELAGGRVAIFFMDTNPFIERYKRAGWYSHPGGVAEQCAEAQFRELEGRLARSKADWKLLIGHHPPRSNGEHGNNPEVIQAFEPLIERYGVQAFFAGHDHSLEHLFHPSGPRYHTVVTGAGSQTLRAFIGKTDSRWQYRWSGFVAAHIRGEELRIDYYTLEGGPGSPAYSVTIPRKP